MTIGSEISGRPIDRGRNLSGDKLIEQPMLPPHRRLAGQAEKIIRERLRVSAHPCAGPKSRF
jgi:hypothetical protein